MAAAPPAPKRKPPPPPPPPPVSEPEPFFPAPPAAPGSQDAAEVEVNEGLPPLALAMRLLVLPPPPPAPAAMKSVTPLRTSELAPPPPPPPPENPLHPASPPRPPAGGPGPPAEAPPPAGQELSPVMPPGPPCPTTADKTSFAATFNTAVYSVALPPFPPGPLSIPPPPPAPPFIFTTIWVTPAGTVKVDPDVIGVVAACASPVPASRANANPQRAVRMPARTTALNQWAGVMFVPTVETCTTFRPLSDRANRAPILELPRAWRPSRRKAASRNNIALITAKCCHVSLVPRPA